MTVVKYSPVSTSTAPNTYAFASGDTAFTVSKKIKLVGLTPGTEYRFMVDVIGSNGAVAHSEEKTFTTKYPSEVLGNLSILERAADLQNRLEEILQSALPSIAPPFLDDPRVTDISENSATISWNTNVKSYAVLVYAPEDSFAKTGAYENEMSDLESATMAHTLSLENLEPSTRYHFSARSFVFPEVLGRSADITFTTKAAPIELTIIDVIPESFRALWTTSNAASSILNIKDIATGESQTISDEELVKAHDATVERLKPGHAYQITASGYTKDGVFITSSKSTSITMPVDRIAPNIISLKIDSALVPGRSNVVQSIVSWSTDKPATSVVYYDEGSAGATKELKNKVENTTGFVQSHVVVIPSLVPGKVYRIQVSSTDQAGNTETLPVRTIVTPQQTGSIVDVIFKNFSDTFEFLR